MYNPKQKLNVYQKNNLQGRGYKLLLWSKIQQDWKGTRMNREDGKKINLALSWNFFELVLFLSWHELIDLFPKN